VEIHRERVAAREEGMTLMNLGGALHAQGKLVEAEQALGTGCCRSTAEVSNRTFEAIALGNLAGVWTERGAVSNWRDDGYTRALDLIRKGPGTGDSRAQCWPTSLGCAGRQGQIERRGRCSREALLVDCQNRKLTPKRRTTS
jgi:hypothetical protein